MKIAMAAVVMLGFSFVSGGTGPLAQEPPKAVVDELVERHKPRLQGLTAEAIERVWREQVQSEPWFRKLHAQWAAQKDDPDIVQTLRDDPSCAEVDPSNQDTTFQGQAKQYRCMGDIRERDYSGQMVVYVNVNGSGLLASAVMLARIPLPFPFGGIGPDEQAALLELYSDMTTRMDNARAPPGSHVEYSKDLEYLKFAAQFR